MIEEATDGTERTMGSLGSLLADWIRDHEGSYALLRSHRTNKVTVAPNFQPHAGNLDVPSPYRNRVCRLDCGVRAPIHFVR
jgi:hypothetical protein